MLSKSLADHLGQAIFSGTIKGKNQLWKTYEAAKDSDDWFSLWQDIDASFRTETGATIELLKVALEDDRRLIAQKLMTQEEFNQEWYLSPSAAVKGAIYAQQIAEAQREGRIGIVPYDRSLKVHSVWDLGKGTNMAVGFYQRAFGQVKLIDAWQGEANEGLPEAIKEVLRKPYIYGKHFAPHDIKATDLSTGKTRWETAKKLGIEFAQVPDVGVENGIHAGQLLWSKLWIDEVKCAKFLEAIGQYQREWDDRRGDFKRDPYHNWASHQADQFRYAAVVEDKMTNEAQDATRAITRKIELDPYPKRVTPDYQVSFSGGTLDEDPYE